MKSRAPSTVLQNMTEHTLKKINVQVTDNIANHGKMQRLIVLYCIN